MATWTWSYQADDGDQQISDITITATDAAGNQTLSTFSLDVNDVAPTVDWSLDKTTVDEGSTVSLRINEIVDRGVDFATQAIIDWGDGQTTTIDGTPITPQLLQHTYADGAASSTIVITVVDEDGSHTLDNTIDVHVLNVRPTITSFHVPTSVDEGSFVALSATAIDAAGAADPLSAEWTIVAPDGSQTVLEGFGDGGGIGFTPALGQGGAYTVKLEVADDDGGLTMQEAIVEVQGPPVVSAGGPYTVNEGESIQIDGATTTDPNQDADTLTYLWDFDGDGIFGETDSNATQGDELGIDAVFAAGLLDGDATANIVLRVLDDTGLMSESQTTVNVENVAPIVPAQTFFVDEGVANGTFVGQVGAHDFIADTRSFAITGGTGLAVFNIDSTTGELTVADANQLNHSTTPVLTLDVQVSDDDGDATTTTMTIRVEDVGSLEVVQFQVDDGHLNCPTSICWRFDLTKPPMSRS